MRLNALETLPSPRIEEHVSSMKRTSSVDKSLGIENVAAIEKCIGIENVAEIEQYRAWKPSSAIDQFRAVAQMNLMPLKQFGKQIDIITAWATAAITAEQHGINVLCQINCQ